MVTQAQADLDPREHLGRDISLDNVDDVKIGRSDDFQLITFDDNLKQAMINRLRTAIGEITLHPDYGSQLHEVLGTNPTDDTLLLVRSHVRAALLQEPRIETIDDINVFFRDNDLRTDVDVEVSVTPIQELETLNLVFRLFFEGTLVGGPN